MMALLFPGKTVKDVMRSHAAVAARQALDNLTITSSPVRLKPLDAGYELQSIRFLSYLVLVLI